MWYRILLLLCLFNLAAATDAYDFRGKHLLASYNGCDPGAIQDAHELIKLFEQAARESGATVLNASHYVFPGNGLTMVILLSESHCSIHTYPEYGACFVDLFTCGTKCSHEKFDEILRTYLKPTEVNSKVYIRHQSFDNILDLKSN